MGVKLEAEVGQGETTRAREVEWDENLAAVGGCVDGKAREEWEVKCGDAAAVCVAGLN